MPDNLKPATQSGLDLLSRLLRMPTDRLEAARKKMVHRIDALTVDRRDVAIEDAQRYVTFYMTEVAARVGELTRELAALTNQSSHAR